jgi:glycosyltransferase involved in cell wall biosynthesis
LTSAWAARGDAVTLFVEAPADTDFYDVDAQVTVVRVPYGDVSSHVSRRVLSNGRHTARLTRAIGQTKPDVIVSFQDATNVRSILAARALGIPAVVSERIDPRLHDIGPLWDSLRKITYPFAASVVMQTKGASRWAETLPVRPRIDIIPNPCTPPSATDDPGVALPPGPFIAAMGRLVAQKGFDLLIPAFANAAPPEWSLVILGEGPERAALDSLAIRWNARGRVHFLSRHPSPGGILARAAIFVLSSRFEGFPNALIEAMSLGLPVIATACPSGPEDIVRDGVDGLLVPTEDAAALERAIGDLARSPARRRTLASRATEVVDRYGLERVLTLWDGVFRDVVHVGGRFGPLESIVSRWRPRSMASRGCRDGAARESEPKGCIGMRTP